MACSGANFFLPLMKSFPILRNVSFTELVILCRLVAVVYLFYRVLSWLLFHVREAYLNSFITLVSRDNRNVLCKICLWAIFSITNVHISYSGRYLGAVFNIQSYCRLHNL